MTRQDDKQVILPHKDVYIRLRPSNIHGVGVLAVCDIPTGTDPFLDCNDEHCFIGKDKVASLPPEIRKLYQDFCVEEGGLYYCPVSFNRMDVAWYLNHSKQPNMVFREVRNTFGFFTAQDIKTGEELTIDYDTYNDIPFNPDI